MKGLPSPMVLIDQVITIDNQSYLSHATDPLAKHLQKQAVAILVDGSAEFTVTYNSKQESVSTTTCTPVQLVAARKSLFYELRVESSRT